MSGFDGTSEFPDIGSILKWAINSQLGLCCGIFGCTGKVASTCKICNGYYCNEHIEWHTHSKNFDGVVIK